MKENSKVSILIVDDQPENLQAIINVLQESTIPVLILRAPNGQIALTLAKKRNPDLVITDWEMPGMDGIELIRELRKHSSTKDTPVIMCTGVMTTSESLQLALESGASDYIRKPIDPIELIARTNAMLQLSTSFKKIKKQNLQLLESYKKMEQMACTDPLTLLSNRRSFLENLKHEKALADRNGCNFVLLLGDIDNFKAFNDTYGHDCGDFVLVSLAKLLKQLIRRQDQVGRWGGEEFILLFSETNLEQGILIAEKIRAEIHAKVYKFQDLELKTTLTFGLYVYDHEEEIDSCLKHADEALYAGKHAGRNRVEVFNALN